MALFLWGCGGPPKRVVYDLAERVFIADRSSASEVFLFGTPAAEPHEILGFYREGRIPAGERFAWAKGEAEVALDWSEVRDRSAVVDVAPYQGVRNQSVEVRLNGTPVGRLALNDFRHRYKVELPKNAQRAGSNRLLFVFASTASPSRDPQNPDRRQLAAAFYSLIVGDRDEPWLDDMLRREAPRPFSVVEEQGVPSLVQMGPSSIRYTIKLPQGAELRFAPLLHTAARTADGTATFRVSIEDAASIAAGRQQELWKGVVSARDPSGKPREAVVPLPGKAGEIVRIGLHVVGERFAWGVWRAPRILGRDKPGSSSSAPPETHGATDLRGALQNLNVVLVILDAAGARHFGCYGYPRATTPEIDRIAAEGVVFERATTAAVYTLGAMSSLWTSQYPDRHHAEVSYADRLPKTRLTLAETLSMGGVHSAGFVANAVAGTAFGFERGFAEFHEVFRMFPDLGSRGEAFRRVLPGWFAKQKDRRFFAYVHFREPHFPYDPGPPFDTLFGPDRPLTREQRRDKGWYTDVNQGRVAPTPAEVDHLVRLYDGNLAYADREVGALRQALEAAGLWDRTVLMITADHGEQLFEHGYISHSAQVYQESAHVPLIVRFPAGRGPSGLRVGGLADLLDLAPTVLDVFGLRLSGRAAKEFEGTSLLSLLAGAPGKPMTLSRTVWERPVYALQDERFKLIYDTRTGAAQLFNLDTDPRESRSLHSEEALRTAYYQQDLHNWIEKLEGRAYEMARGEPAPSLGREQCENMKALGYVVAECR